MKKFFNQNLIILSVVVFFVVSSFVLSWSSNNQKNRQKNFWVVYFSDPKNENPSFIIENQQKEKEFRYEIWKDGENTGGNVILLSQGGQKKIEIPEKSEEEKILVKVSSGGEEQEIYKN